MKALLCCFSRRIKRRLGAWIVLSTLQVEVSLFHVFKRIRCRSRCVSVASMVCFISPRRSILKRKFQFLLGRIQQTNFETDKRREWLHSWTLKAMQERNLCSQSKFWVEKLFLMLISIWSSSLWPLLFHDCEGPGLPPVSFSKKGSLKELSFLV